MESRTSKGARVHAVAKGRCHAGVRVAMLRVNVGELRRKKVGGLGSPDGFTRVWGGEYVFGHERVLEWVLLERVGGFTCRGSGGEVEGWKL